MDCFTDNGYNLMVGGRDSETQAQRMGFLDHWFSPHAAATYVPSIKKSPACSLAAASNLTESGAELLPPGVNVEAYTRCLAEALSLAAQCGLLRCPHKAKMWAALEEKYGPEWRTIGE